MTPNQAARMALPDLSSYAPVMTKRQVADVMGRSVRWVELHVAAGDFPIPRLARSLRIEFSKADVQRYFEQKTFQPPAAASLTRTA